MQMGRQQQGMFVFEAMTLNTIRKKVSGRNFGSAANPRHTHTVPPFVRPVLLRKKKQPKLQEI